MANGLLYAQRFPWQKDMGIYFLNGLHSMHCLVSLGVFYGLWYEMDVDIDRKMSVALSLSIAEGKLSQPPSTTSTTALTRSAKT